MNKSGIPHLQLGPAGVSVTSVQFPLGSLPRCCPDCPFVTTGVSFGDESQQFSDSYTPVTPLIHEMELGSFFPFSLLPFPSTSWLRVKALLVQLLDISVLYVQRTWLAQDRGVCSIFCPLVLPQCSCTLVYLMGHALEQEMSPTSSLPLPSLLSPTSSTFLCFVSPGSPPFILFPSNPLAPLWEGVFP